MLIDFLRVLHEDINTSSDKEIRKACELIINVQALSPGECETLKAAFERGPLFDGDVPSKNGRDLLLDKGYIAKVVVKGQDGYNACTHEGAWAYRLIKVGAWDVNSNEE